MTEILKDGKDVIFYELDDLPALPDKIRELLASRSRWEELQQNAYHTAAAAHTWAHRAQYIHKEILCKIY